MADNFILVPDKQIFETACLARSNDSMNHSCLKLFSGAWRYYIDSREKIIHISKNLDSFLIEKKYKSEKEKRQALFTVLLVREGFSECDANSSQIKLASRLSIEEDKKVYFVTDNKGIADLLKDGNVTFEVIDSAVACEIINKLDTSSN